MWRHRLIAMLRAAPALALAATILAAPTPVGADAPVPEHMHPAMRVQVVVKSVYIWSDTDGGNGGELELKAHLTCFAASQPCPGSQAELDLQVDTFTGETGDTITRNLVLPRTATNFHPEYAASVTSGYPLYEGQSYELRFEMSDREPTGTNTPMGERHIVMRSDIGWSLGTYSLRATHPRSWGDYTIDFEVRKAALPDLYPQEIKVQNLPGRARDLVCLPIVNGGDVDAGPFGVVLRVSGALPPGGRIEFGGLAVGETREQCVEADLPKSGQVELGMAIDDGDSVTEISELNNYHVQLYVAGPTLQEGAPAPGESLPATDVGRGGKPSPSPLPLPGPSSSQTQADLTVGAVTVNGRVPDGKNDCKDGKNTVSVVVKNAGVAKAGELAVRLLVDGAHVAEQAVSGLDAGKDREVRFEDVRLKKGEHSLVAIADPSKAVAEANDGNNELKVTVRCTDNG